MHIPWLVVSSGVLNMDIKKTLFAGVLLCSGAFAEESFLIEQSAQKTETKSDASEYDVLCEDLLSSLEQVLQASDDLSELLIQKRRQVLKEVRSAVQNRSKQSTLKGMQERYATLADKLRQCSAEINKIKVKTRKV